MFDRNLAELRAVFERDGYVVVKGVFEPERCDEMVDQIWQMMPASFLPNDRRTWIGRIQDCCNNLPLYQRNGLLRYKDREGFRRNFVFARHIYGNPRFSKIFQGLTGRSLGRVHIRGLHPVMPMPRLVSFNEALGNRLNRQMNGPERRPVKVPRPPQVPIPGHLDAHAVDVLMMVYIDDVGARGGGLTVWPGSHRLLELCFNSRHEFFPTAAYKRCINFLQRFRPRHIAGSKGDLIVFHNRLLHSNSVNRTRRIRHAVLIDAFGKDVAEQDRLWLRDRAVTRARKALASSKNIDKHPVATAIRQRLRFDAARAFWSAHPRLTAWVQSIAKDPVGEARRSISAKIRMRSAGDYWIVISQDRTHRLSPKLDAYGTADLGSFDMSLNSGPAIQSVGGVMVERLDVRNGPNSVVIGGRFAAEHFVRIVRTSNPLDRSDIVYSGHLPAGSAIELPPITFEAQSTRAA